MNYVRDQNQKLSDLAELVLDMYRRINLFNNNTVVVHDKTKSGIICLGRNKKRILSNYQYLMNEAEQKIRGQQLIKPIPNQAAWSKTKMLKLGSFQFQITDFSW